MFHRAVILVALMSSACSARLDPERLERIEYGMSRSQVEAALAYETDPWLRWWDTDGRECDVFRLFSSSPHPAYAAVYEDDGLVAVLVDDEWRALLPTEPLPDPERVAIAIRLARDRRLALDWSAIEPIDAAHETDEPGGLTHAVGLAIVYFPIVLAGVALSPILVPLNLALSAGPERAYAEHMDALLALESGASPQQAEAGVGAPQLVQHGGPGVEFWGYDPSVGADAFPESWLAFQHGRLRWILFAGRHGRIARLQK